MMFPFIAFLINVVIFYVIVRLVTKNPHLDFWQCLLWIAGAYIVGIVARVILGTSGFMIEDPVREIAWRVVKVGALAVILWARSGFSQRQIGTIIAFYAGWPFIIYGLVAILSR
ncbi:hypothetical protein KKH27_02215 [bacterium]|nr:hypothetical protein [bacterium]MBU1985150.1 hypothetical protein [bacterium]